MSSVVELESQFLLARKMTPDEFGKAMADAVWAARRSKQQGEYDVQTAIRTWALRKGADSEAERVAIVQFRWRWEILERETRPEDVDLL